MTPNVVPELKEVIRHLTIEHAQTIAAHAQTLEVARDVENYLRGEMKKLCPDLFL